MKTIAEIRDIVQNYAKQSHIFTTPASPNDPLLPLPSSLTAADQSEFFRSLMQALAAEGVNAQIPPEALIACTSWSQIRILVFQGQA